MVSKQIFITPPLYIEEEGTFLYIINIEMENIENILARKKNEKNQKLLHGLDGIKLLCEELKYPVGLDRVLSLSFVL